MPEEKKQQNKSVEISLNKGSFDVSSALVFKDNPQLVFLYKKTEKLVSALYLLTSFISDKEPVKWQIREAGVNLLNQSLNLSDRTSAKQISIHFDFISNGFKLLSFLKICHISGLISEMNFNILKYEIEALITNVESEEKESDGKGAVFPAHFFEVSREEDLGSTFTNHKSLIPEGNTYKGHNIMSDRYIRPIGGMSDKQKPVRHGNPGGDKSNRPSSAEASAGRQEIIIGLLKKNKELGIKDFATSIKDCSEKTIQRELASLISKGQVLKDGEKRWSRYSLK